MISDSLRVSFKTKLLKVIYTYLTPFVSVFAVICAVLCCFKSAEGKNSRTVSFICLLISFSVIAVIKLLNMLYSKKSLEYSNYQLKFAKRIDPQTLVPLSVLVILVVLPFYILVITSLKNSAEANFIRFTWWPKTGIDLESFKQLFTYASVIGVTIAEAILNSFIYAFIPTFVGLFVSALSAYAFAKLEFKKKNLFYSLLIMTMMMPGCVTMTTAYIMYERYGWTNTVLPLIVPGCFGSAATVMFLREYFMGIPDGMLEAAKIDGSGKWRCFSKIMIPLGTDAVIDMRGDCHTSRESNFKRAIKANGVLNSGNTAGATLEAFFPWSSLQIDPKNGLPDTFSVISSFRAVLPGDAECTASNYVVAKCSADRSTPLAENALFANSVAVNGSRVYSATDRWDISELSNNVLNGSYEMGSSLYPMYFSKQGNRMLISTTVEYTTDIDSVGVSNCQSDLLAGIMLSSGSNNGWIGVRQSGIVYNEHWITNVIPYDVLTTWARNYTKIKLEVLLINGNLFFCVDNSYVTRVAVSDVVSDTDGNSNFAIGLIMGADKTANAQFSNISFTTDSAELGRFIDKYEIPEEKPYDPSVQSYIQYARALGKGYKNGNSETVAVLNENTTVFIGDSFFDGRQFWTDFYDDDYKNANAFLAGIGSTTVDNWLNLKDEVLAGFKDCSPKNIVMHLGTNSLWDDSATPESVASELKELFNRLHESYPTSNIYYFSITHRDIGEDNDRIDAVNSIISSWCETKPYVTFINTANRITSSILYDQIHPRLGCYSIFTEELQKAGCVILDNNGNTYIPPASETALFADYITLNGKSFASALDKWATGKEGVAKASYENGCALKPVYFSATGNKALLETTVKCTTNFSAGNYETIPMAGITVTDGINSGILGIRQNSIVYNERIIQPAINYDTLSSWDLNHHSVDLKIALNNGKFYVYVDDVFITGIAVSDVVTGADENAELAVGLIMNADRNASLEFGNISFVTDESKVNEFLGTRNSLFVTRVPLGANIAWSSLGSWDQSKIAENTLTATNTLNSSWQPAYFAEFGNAGLMHATVTRTDNIGESGATGDPIAALKVSDGINGNCYIGVRQNAVIYTGDIAIWGTLPSYVLTTWSSLEDLSFELDIALKDGYFYLYIDGIYVTKIELSKVVPGATPNTDLAFGITSYTGGKAEIEFSNISFTTDKAKISAFLEK